MSKEARLARDHCELRNCGPEPLGCIFDVLIIHTDKFVNDLNPDAVEQPSGFFI